MRFSKIGTVKNAVRIIYNMGPMVGDIKKIIKLKKNRIFERSIFDINDICIGDMNKPLPDSKSAWNFTYIDRFKSWKTRFFKFWILNISILLINLSWIAQMMLGPIKNCRKLLGVQSCLNMVLFRAIGYPFMPKQGSTAKYKVAKFKIWHGRIPKSPNAK